MTAKERFIEIYTQNITREGSDKLLDFLLNGSDFFTAPASTRYHGAHEGGLVEHSLNVYDCLKDMMDRPRMKEVYGIEYPEESIAIAALLHDVCKVNFYKTSYRNAKDETGRWQSVPYYTIEDTLPYGHGEKSAYIVSAYMRLTRDEAFAIRYHMGFSTNSEARDVSAAYAMFPLCYAVSSADMEATYYIEQ